jgi:hypothetical protein
MEPKRLFGLDLRARVREETERHEVNPQEKERYVLSISKKNPKYNDNIDDR